MAQATYPAPLIEIIENDETLSTTVSYFQLAPRVTQLNLFCPAIAYRMQLCSAIKAVEFYDASAALGSRFIKDGSTNSLLMDLTDKNSGTGTGTVLDSATSSDFLYVCTDDIVGGFHINVKSANGTANTLQITYWDGSAWAALTETDNTDTGASLAVDGSVTFTKPTDAVRTPLGGPNGILRDDNTLQSTVADVRVTDPSAQEGFWWRFNWDNGLDSDTEIEELMTVHGVARGKFRADTESSISIDRRKVGNIEVLSASGTPILEINSLISVAP